MSNTALPGSVVFVRHGESTWNAKGVWTGTRDMHLTPKGKREARLLGVAVKDLQFDRAYVSQQVRAKETLTGLLAAAGQAHVESHVSAALNERDYGDYTGLNKWQAKEKMGEEAFQGLRRGWDYPVPNGETLEDVFNRTVPFYLAVIRSFVAAGQTVLVVAHGNSIRSLIKYIERVSDTGIADVEMPFGNVLMYTIDSDGRMVDKQARRIDTTPPPA